MPPGSGTGSDRRIAPGSAAEAVQKYRSESSPCVQPSLLDQPATVFGVASRSQVGFSKSRCFWAIPPGDQLHSEETGPTNASHQARSPAPAPEMKPPSLATKNSSP